MTDRSEGNPYSLINRRTFLRRVGAVVGAGFVGQLLLPLWRYVLPGRAREPSKVEFEPELLAELNALRPGSCLRFAWGGFPGLLLLASNGKFRIFKGVCSHADCNVAWRPESGDFFCACHEGRYDEFGRNVAGPPPRPLTKLLLKLDRDSSGRIVKATAWRSEAAWRKEAQST